MNEEAIAREYVVPARGWANKDVAGEFYHSEAILPLLPRLPTNGDPVEAELEVDLVPEKDNPHDRRAVSVRADGKVLGYLPREMAADYALPVQRIVASGARLRAAASVYAYVNQWKGEPEIQVRVALPDPEMMTPLNSGYPTNTTVLPYSRSYQVTKEENHFDRLFDYVPANGTGMVILTMHRKETMLKNGASREVVELRLDGERVGELTPATSKYYLPLVQHARDMDRTIGVWAKLTGSGLAAELTIYGAKSNEVEDEWLRSMPLLPHLVPEAHSYDVPPAFSGKASSSRTGSSTRDKATSRKRTNAPTPPAQDPGGETIYRITELSDEPGKPLAVAGDVALLGFKGDDKNTLRYSVKGKTVEVQDSDRKLSPKATRGAATGALVVSIILGLVMGAIPGIGPVLLIAALVVGIMAFVHMRRVATVLEAEATIDAETRLQTGLSLVEISRQGRFRNG